MTDNLSPSAGTVATDDCAGAHYQKFKQFDATADSVIGQTVTAAFGAYVDVRRMAGAQNTPTVVAVAASATVVTLIAANAARRKLMISNTSAYLMYGSYIAGASAILHTFWVAGGGQWEMPDPIHLGAITALWVTADSGVACVTEQT